MDPERHVPTGMDAEAVDSPSLMGSQAAVHASLLSAIPNEESAMTVPSNLDRSPPSISIPAFLSILCAVSQLVLFLLAIASSGQHADSFKLFYLLSLCLGFLAGVLGFLSGLLWTAENFPWGASVTLVNVLLLALRFFV